METEVMRNKREFNARAKELVSNGYKKYGDFANRHRFVKCGFFYPETIILVQGWKSS